MLLRVRSCQGHTSYDSQLVTSPDQVFLPSWLPVLNLPLQSRGLQTCDHVSVSVFKKNRVSTLIYSFFFNFFYYYFLNWGIVVLVSTVQRSVVPMLYSRFSLVIYFIHISVYMSIPISQFIPPPPPFPPLVSICLFSMSMSLFLPCKLVPLYHFSRSHIYALIYNICFSLSDLLHSVRQSLGPSTSLQMTQFRSFLWLSNIPLYMCTTSLSIHLSMGI